MEAEWESSKSKSTREVTQYETLVGAADALHDHDALLTLSMADVRDGTTGWEGGLPTQYIVLPSLLATYVKHYCQTITCPFIFTCEGFLAKMVVLKMGAALLRVTSMRFHKFRRTRNRRQ